MTESYFPFDSGAGANITESQWQKMAQYWRTTGVIQNLMNELQVYADSTGMQVKVKSGGAWMKGHYYESTSEQALSIGTADPSNPRIDRVVLRVDWTANTIQLVVLQGTPAVSPTVPALTQNTSRWEITLAKVSVSAGDTTIAAGDITDERYNTIFIAPTLLNGWVASNNVTYPVRYWKDNEDMVYFEAALKNGATGMNNVIWYFPVGYRPDSAVMFNGYAESATANAAAIFHVANNGETKLLRDIIGNSLLIMRGSFKAVN